jgi:hypothetical protein
MKTSTKKQTWWTVIGIYEDQQVFTATTKAESALVASINVARQQTKINVDSDSLSILAIIRGRNTSVWTPTCQGVAYPVEDLIGNQYHLVDNEAPGRPETTKERTL